MAVGKAIGVPLVICLATRLAITRPPHARTGCDLLDRIAISIHRLFYALIAGMVPTRLATTFRKGPLPFVNGGAANTLPPGLETLSKRAARALFALAPVCLMALHFAADLYRRLYYSDGLFRRMRFG